MAASMAPKQNLQPEMNAEKVLIVGGSMAHGWKDPNDDSYLKRAFSELTSSTDTTWIYDDHTTIGGSPAENNIQSKFRTWVQQDKPQVVVISWGLLNDIVDKTPMRKFNQAIRGEIQDALAAHAVVVFVTSPVTEATETYDHQQVANYISNEIHDAQSFHSPNVYFLNLNQQMETYMAAHGQTWLNYYGDSWHPNQAGHILAGKLLFDEWIQTFGTGPVRWQPDAKDSSQENDKAGK
ncbi:SGNH/GDSL hydrolase family protein [Alicyclobacillus cycloheptanicus]|nr:SGNH/GDSL hydrolase family protein [Alicyclobacillus cycloheptanicus]